MAFLRRVEAKIVTVAFRPLLPDAGSAAIILQLMGNEPDTLS
jgi:hypothetical protein